MDLMAKLKRIGIVVIIVGVFIPSVLYPFTSLTKRAIELQVKLGRAYKPRLNDLEIVLKEEKWIQDENYQPLPVQEYKKGSIAEEIRAYLEAEEEKKRHGHYEGHIIIPYHYTLAIGITIVFLGIILMALAGKKIKEDYD